MLSHFGETSPLSTRKCPKQITAHAKHIKIINKITGTIKEFTSELGALSVKKQVALERSV